MNGPNGAINGSVHGPGPGPTGEATTDSEVFGGARRAARYQENAPAAFPPTEGPARFEAAAPVLPASRAPIAAPPADPKTIESPEPAPPPGPAAPGSPPVRPRPDPAQWGWQARVRRYSAGLLKPVPAAQELAHRDAVTAIRQATFTRAVNVVVANPKGGTGKTPATLLLAGALAEIRGGFVCAFEACESGGSLAARAEGNPARGLGELLTGIASVATVGNLGGYTAPQTSHADVIGSVTERRALAAEDVLAVRRVLDTYYRITLTDTGNSTDHRAHLTALRTADAAVVPCLVSLDALAGAQAAVDAIGMAAGGMPTVLVLGRDGGPENPQVAATVRAGLGDLVARGYAAELVEVPYDPAIRLGGPLSLSALSTASRRAWTMAAAAAVRALLDADTSTDRVAEQLLTTHQFPAGSPAPVPSTTHFQEA